MHLKLMTQLLIMIFFVAQASINNNIQVKRLWFEIRSFAGLLKKGLAKIRFIDMNSHLNKI